VELAMTEPNVREALPFFRVTDLPTALRFYVDGLGFRVTNHWPDEGPMRWCTLTLGGASLMLQSLVDDEGRAVPLATTRGVGVSVSFMCRDALAIAEDARSHGVVGQEPFVGNGLWVASFTDPDGYRVDFSSPTDVAEETTLSAWRARRS
jgi:lactoylglutathione lyase